MKFGHLGFGILGFGLSGEYSITTWIRVDGQKLKNIIPTAPSPFYSQIFETKIITETMASTISIFINSCRSEINSRSEIVSYNFTIHHISNSLFVFWAKKKIRTTLHFSWIIINIPWWGGWLNLIKLFRANWLGNTIDLVVEMKFVCICAICRAFETKSSFHYIVSTSSKFQFNVN